MNRAPIDRTDKERLDFVERCRATVYRSMAASHWVFVDERRRFSDRNGIIGETLREAIDNAMSETAK